LATPVISDQVRREAKKVEKHCSKWRWHHFFLMQHVKEIFKENLMIKKVSLVLKTNIQTFSERWRDRHAHE